MIAVIGKPFTTGATEDAEEDREHLTTKDAKEHKGEYETWWQPESLPARFIPAGFVLPELPSCSFVSFVVKVV